MKFRIIQTTCLFVAAIFTTVTRGADRPNILWIIPDDMSAHFSCYGETTIQTPHVDALAKRGLQFNKAFVTAPVCSTCRSAFITGMYQTSIGAHHHRSGRGELKIHLPDHIQMIPQMFKSAGYHTSISGWPNNNRLGKTDYNFQWDRSIYDGSDWGDRKPGQPFFAQLQTKGGKLRGASSEAAKKIAATAAKTFGKATDVAEVTLPPYYPRDAVILEDWAAYLDSVRLTDEMVGEVIARLKKDGDYDNTVIIFMTDHGISHARGKQFLYEEGIHVPLVIAGPGIDPGARDDLVEHIDIAALSLGLAGIKVPDYMQAKDILAADYQPREVVFSARDRCDETVDHLRSVRSAKYKYIRNFLPNRPHMQPCAYKDAKAIVQSLRHLHAQGKLNELQARIFQPTRPPEELYDLESDPHESINLANVSAHKATLEKMRGQLDQWMESSGDMGINGESPEMFESDMAVYVSTLKSRKKDPAHIKTIEDNIALMRKWAAEGK